MFYKRKITTSIKIIVATLVSLGFLFMFRKIKSPKESLLYLKRIINNNKVNIMYKLGKKRTIKLSKPGTQYIVPTVYYAKSDKKIVVYYKGERLEIWTYDPRVPLSKSDLEFFYKMKKKHKKSVAR